MSLELLKFPSLCLQYFKTITFVCELYPEKICALNPDLQKNLVASLELGLTSLGVDTVYSLCCDFIQVLCSYMLRFHVKNVPMYEALRPFLKVITVRSTVTPRMGSISSTFYEQLIRAQIRNAQKKTVNVSVPVQAKT